VYCGSAIHFVLSFSLLLGGFEQVELTTKDWDECSLWLTALKSLIKMRQLLG